jgi:hypothetical protein
VVDRYPVLSRGVADGIGKGSSEVLHERLITFLTWDFRDTRTLTCDVPKVVVVSRCDASAVGELELAVIWIGAERRAAPPHATVRWRGQRSRERATFSVQARKAEAEESAGRRAP